MERKKVTYLQLFKSLFIISAVTFGGGYTIIPIIKDEFVTRRKAITEDEMVKIVTLAQSLPGVMTISTSFLTGYSILGVGGAIVATVASLLPCIMVISVIAFSYKKVIENVYVQNVLSGISGSVAALLFITVYSLLKKGLTDKDRNFYITIFLISLFLRYIFNLDIMYIILIAGVISYLYNRGDKNDWVIFNIF